MLEGFKIVNLTIGLPYVSFTNNGVTFSKSILIKMDQPEYVVLMMNEQQKKVAIQICEKDTPGAAKFAKDKKVLNVRWNNKDFLNTVSRLMDWNLKEDGYRVLGEWYEQEKVMIFDLSEAEKINGRNNESDD